MRSAPSRALGVSAAREPSESERPSTLTALASEPAEEVSNEPRRDAHLDLGDDNLDLAGCEISRAEAVVLVRVPLLRAGRDAEAAEAARSALSARSAAAICPVLVPAAAPDPSRHPRRERVLLHVLAGGPPPTRLGSPPLRRLYASRTTRHARPPPPTLPLPPPPPAAEGAGAAAPAAWLPLRTLKLRCGPSAARTP